MNKIGEEGFINHTGKFGASADLIHIDAENFFDNIEEGIYNTVKVLVENGFFTCSSCQGHVGYNKARTVTVQGTKEDINYLKSVVWRVRQCDKNLKVQYMVLPLMEKGNIYKENLDHCAKIMIYFGPCDLASTLKGQDVFEKYIVEGSREKYTYDSKYEMYALDISNHSDVLCD